MGWKQLRVANTNKPYRGGLCHKAVRDMFGIGLKYPSATDSWNSEPGAKHTDRPPAGISVPIYFSLSGEPAGHDAVQLADGRVASASQPGNHGTMYIHSSIDALMSYYSSAYRIEYLGWRESVNNVPVVQYAADAKPQPKPSTPDQRLEVGSKIAFKRTYRVDDIKNIGGLWQVRTNALCPVGFTWNDNGIPTAPLHEVAGGVGNGNDQILQVGSVYTIPGVYSVLQLGKNQGRWLAQIKMGAYKLWVDVATVTEV